MNLKFAESAKLRWFTASVLVLALVVGLVPSASATLTGGSTFESNDGNLVVNTTGLHDWNGPVEPISCPNTIPGSGTNCGLDLVKNQSDNAFGQGAKEDDPAPTVVNGSIPPSKDDLSRFYVNKEKVGGNDYLYLAWERSNLLGSAHMDFEFNQSSAPGANGVTPVRTAGDLLIDFDFGGSGLPVLQKHTWITTGNPASCEANNTLPCWDKGVDLGANAEAQVNSAPVVDDNPPGNPRTLDGNTKNGINSTFGEAGINLTGAGIFPPDVCRHFGSASLKSRSSGNSFTSELKDFIAPIPVNISNCGSVTIIKHTDPRGVNQDFGYTSNLTGECTADSTPASFTLNDNGNTSGDSTANTEACVNVLTGTYTVTEGADPSGFAFVSVTCVNQAGNTSSTSGKTATINVVADGSTTCTYVNQQQLGAIKITKTSSKTGHGLNGATFSITKGGTAITGSPFTTANGGVICVDNLGFGAYVVTETGPPTGFSIDDATSHTVTVDNNAKCSDASYVGESISFTDTPLSDIQVRFRDGGSGETQLVGTLSCNNATGTSSTADTTGWDDTLTVTGIKIDSVKTITCTIVIDP